jgi:hypothetical protein
MRQKIETAFAVSDGTPSDMQAFLAMEVEQALQYINLFNRKNKNGKVQSGNRRK